MLFYFTDVVSSVISTAAIVTISAFVVVAIFIGVIFYFVCIKCPRDVAGIICLRPTYRHEDIPLLTGKNFKCLDSTQTDSTYLRVMLKFKIYSQLVFQKSAIIFLLKINKV